MANREKPPATYVTVNLRVPLALAHAIDQLHGVEAAREGNTAKSRFARTIVSKHAMYIAALEMGLPQLVRDLSGDSQQAGTNHPQPSSTTTNHVATAQPSSTVDSQANGVQPQHGGTPSAARMLFELSAPPETKTAKYHDPSDPMADEDFDVDALMADT